MAIEIHGYEAIIPNEVYGRDILHASKGRVCPAEEIIIPTRYNFPSKENVAEILRSRIEQNNEKKRKSNIVQMFKNEEDLELEDILNYMPQNVLDLFLAGSIEIPRHDIRKQGEYVSLMLGIIPKNGRLKTAADYNSEIFESHTKDRAFGEVLQMDVLADKGILPPLDEMKFLLKKGVICSETFVLSGSYLFERAAEILSLFYSGISAPEQIGKLRDVSREVLDAELAEAVNELSYDAKASVIK
ncbi:hypothetical protein KY308_00185 [Candidatus Woesearchaeota archaeon]|nr:hypothetical protein [Candidatus Woesearchaeota archaeon]